MSWHIYFNLPSIILVISAYRSTAEAGLPAKTCVECVVSDIGL